jgi:hypothetical protein
VPHERYRLEIEAMPSTAGTPISRLKRLLKLFGWYRFRCRSIEELPAATFPLTVAPAEELQKNLGDPKQTGIDDTRDPK